MSFKIRHEQRSISIILIVSLLLLCGLSCFFIVNDMYLRLQFNLILQILLLAVLIIEQNVRTVITVDDDTVEIKHIFKRITLDIGQISDIQAERYQKVHQKNDIEPRFRMIISLDSGKKVLLNDTAAAGGIPFGILSYRRKKLPLNKIELFKAYRFIMKKWLY